MNCTPDAMIKDVVDKLADKLAVFCFEHFEEDLNSGGGTDMNTGIGQEVFEEELQVGYSKAIRG